MALRDCSAKRVLLAWVVGIGAELVLVAAAAAHSRAAESPHERELRLWADRSQREWQARDDSVARGLRRPAAAATPAQKAAIQSVLRDSLGFAWETRGETTTVKGPPAFDSAVHRTVTGLGRALLLAEVLYLSIPVTLIGLTVSWLAVRRPWQRRARIEPYATEL